MSRDLEALSKFVASPSAAVMGVVVGEIVLYFLAGRAVAALVTRRGREVGRDWYTAAYVAVGGLAVNFVAFLVLFAGVHSLRAAYAISLVLFAGVAIWRWRALINFRVGWALLVLVLMVFAFRVPGATLLQAEPQMWDEFTHWAGRARQILLLDRLPVAGEPLSGVAPHYGLFATMLAVGSYVPLGREVAGAGIAWSLIFTLIMAIHSYEYLRRHGVSRLFAGPACTWFLAWMMRGQDLLATSMYADIFVAVGGMLAVLHLCDFGLPSVGETRRAEDGLLAASGLGILVFTKTTGDVIAAGAIGYAGLVLLIGAIARRSPRTVLAGGVAIVLAVIPALGIRAAWMGYGHLNNPSAEQLLLERGGRVSDVVHRPEVPWGKMIGVTFDGIVHEEPYSVLLAALPGCILLDVFLRAVSGRRPRSARLSLLLGWTPLVVVMFAVVLNVTFGPGRANLDGGRYLAALLPVLLCYLVSVGARFVEWAVSFDGGVLYTRDAATSPVDSGPKTA